MTSKRQVPQHRWPLPGPVALKILSSYTPAIVVKTPATTNNTVWIKPVIQPTYITAINPISCNMVFSLLFVCMCLLYDVLDKLSTKIKDPFGSRVNLNVIHCSSVRAPVLLSGLLRRQLRHAHRPPRSDHATTCSIAACCLCSSWRTLLLSRPVPAWSLSGHRRHPPMKSHRRPRHDHSCACLRMP